MKLKSFGCSFIFGTDLSDDGQNEPYVIGSKLTWPALLAKHLGYEYQTFARPGSGNLQILERLLNNIQNDDTAIYVIGWTWIDRFDFINPSLETPWVGTKWSTLMPVDKSDIAKNYYKNLHSEYQDKFTTLLYIKTAIENLRSKGCKFIMTYMDQLIFCQEWHVNPPIIEMQETVRPYLSSFENKNFLDWSKSKEFAISDMLHPLEQAHQSAAELVLKNLDNWIKS